MRSKEAGSTMKKLLTLLLLSPLAFAEDDLPSVLYCSLGIAQAEMYFNDNGEHWFKLTDGYKIKPTRIVIKKLEVTPSIIRFVQRGSLAMGTIIFNVNRITGLSNGTMGPGTCSLQKPSEQRKF